MQARDLGVLQLMVTPNGIQTVHLPIGFFQNMVFTANKPKFFSAKVAGLSCQGGKSSNVPVSSRVCPTWTIVSPGRQWPGSDTGLGGSAS